MLQVAAMEKEKLNLKKFYGPHNLKEARENKIIKTTTYSNPCTYTYK